MFVRWTEKEKVWEGRGENSAEGPRLVHLETEDRHGFPVSSLCLHTAGKSSSPQGWPAAWGRGQCDSSSFQVFDFELTPEDMKAIDGLDSNIRYCDFQL